MRTAGKRQQKNPVQDQEKEIEELRARLAEARDTLQAIRSGEVDALLVATPEGDRVFTLKGAESAYRTIVENISEGAATLLPDGQILYANSAFSKILDAPLEQIIGARFQDFILDPDRQMVPVLLKKGLTKTARGEITIRNSTGPVHLFISVQKLPDDDQKMRLGMVITDISERKRAEEELRRTHDELDIRVHQRTRELKEVNASLQAEIAERKKAEEGMKRAIKDLERSNKELQQFAYVASHDLQEPLRTVASYVELLALKYKGKLDEKADRYIEYAVEGASRMSALINDLLAYSRVGTRAEAFKDVNMDEVLNKAMKSIKSAIRDNNAVISRDDLPVVKGDEMQLGQLLQNLLANAVKFTKKGEQPRIHVSAERRGAEWVLGVHDNGIGIAPEFQERIFTIFQRLHTREEYAGTGVGLAISKRIVERHGGQIWVASEPGKGSTFYFSLRANVGGGKQFRPIWPLPHGEPD